MHTSAGGEDFFTTFFYPLIEIPVWECGFGGSGGPNLEFG
jgi:hypothetical protein